MPRGQDAILAGRIRQDVNDRSGRSVGSSAMRSTPEGCGAQRGADRRGPAVGMRGRRPRRRKVARLPPVVPSINSRRRPASHGTVNRVAWTVPL
ncbi:MAG: hypothetical protein JWO04_2296 [Gammaproteobacteria bacterium]|nr:hypothetical protein [Gammaproteobacteria bacterium]